jgi:hypothetical protein
MAGPAGDIAKCAFSAAGKALGGYRRRRA